MPDAAMVIEEEIKLSAPDRESLSAVLDDVEVRDAAFSAVESVPLLTTYYDTPTHVFLANRLAFRSRREGRVWRVGLKGHGEVVDGVSRREEIEVRLDGPVRCFADLPEGPLREQVLALVGGPKTPMDPFIVSDIHRRRLKLRLAGESVAELALDVGEVRAGGLRQGILEVELERISGPFEPVKRLAEGLARRHRLVPSSSSKHGVGLCLLGLMESESATRSPGEEAL
ncbi:MAG: CYTH domain-containing protein [Magnetococcales bacterium]|nr:CYTH domain-containing protein [Magnetococcales bacterium]